MDVWPEFLFFENCFEFAANLNMINVIQHDSHYFPRHVLQPGQGYHFTELREQNIQYCSKLLLSLRIRTINLLKQGFRACNSLPKPH